MQLPAAKLQLLSNAERGAAGKGQVRVRLPRQPGLVVGRLRRATAQRPHPDRTVTGNNVTEIAHVLSVPLRVAACYQPREARLPNVCRDYHDGVEDQVGGLGLLSALEREPDVARLSVRVPSHECLSGQVADLLCGWISEAGCSQIRCGPWLKSCPHPL